jgi:hypothetical protein
MTKARRIFFPVTYYDTPSCFSESEFVEWKVLAKLAADASTICDDCTMEYQNKMIKSGTCCRSSWEELKFGRRAEFKAKQNGVIL